MSENQHNGQRRNNNGGNRNNNRNRNNNNRNRNNNNRNRNNNNRSHQKRAPRPLKLTLWQKILKTFGLFNEEKARKQQQQARKNAQANQANKGGAKATSNTRVAKPRKAPEKVPVETPRLYVGNLSYDASETDIEELFKGIGNVQKVEIVYNRHTHRSKGYGFVQMFNVDDAKRAVEVLHEQPFLGRNLIVNGSKARKPSDPTGDNYQGEEVSDVA